MVIFLMIGTTIGLSELQLPAFRDNTLESAGRYMNPYSMLLAGY